MSKIDEIAFLENRIKFQALEIEAHLEQIRRFYEAEDVIIKLQSQIKIMRDALEFYGDGYNWHHLKPGSVDYLAITESDAGDGSFQITEQTDDEYVGGKRARQALKQAGEV